MTEEALMFSIALSCMRQDEHEASVVGDDVTAMHASRWIIRRPFDRSIVIRTDALVHYFDINDTFRLIS